MSLPYAYLFLNVPSEVFKSQLWQWICWVLCAIFTFFLFLLSCRLYFPDVNANTGSANRLQNKFIFERLARTNNRSHLMVFIAKVHDVWQTENCGKDTQQPSLISPLQLCTHMQATMAPPAFPCTFFLTRKKKVQKIVLEQALTTCLAFWVAYFLFYFQLLNSHVFVIYF